MFVERKKQKDEYVDIIRLKTETLVDVGSQTGESDLRGRHGEKITMYGITQTQTLRGAKKLSERLADEPDSRASPAKPPPYLLLIKLEEE